MSFQHQISSRFLTMPAHLLWYGWPWSGAAQGSVCKATGCLDFPNGSGATPCPDTGVEDDDGNEEELVGK